MMSSQSQDQPGLSMFHRVVRSASPITRQRFRQELVSQRTLLEARIAELQRLMRSQETLRSEQQKKEALNNARDGGRESVVSPVNHTAAKVVGMPLLPPDNLFRSAQDEVRAMFAALRVEAATAADPEGATQDDFLTDERDMHKKHKRMSHNHDEQPQPTMMFGTAPEAELRRTEEERQRGMELRQLLQRELRVLSEGGGRSAYSTRKAVEASGGICICHDCTAFGLVAAEQALQRCYRRSTEAFQRRTAPALVMERTMVAGPSSSSSSSTSPMEEGLLLRLREAELLAQRTTLQRQRDLYRVLHRCDEQVRRLLQEVSLEGNSEPPSAQLNAFRTNEKLASIVAGCSATRQETVQVAARLRAARQSALDDVLPFIVREGQWKSLLSMLLTFETLEL